VDEYHGKKFSHLDENGGVRMVDVGGKPVTRRTARAQCTVLMAGETLRSVVEERVAKGSVLTTAKIAGILAAKRVGELIPLCHPIQTDQVDILFENTFDEPDDIGRLQITSSVSVNARTGAEMEALQAAAQAALTVYDMCKSLEKSMVITDLRLIEKTGGRSGWIRE
jgi:cyclic pyranopterin phosphate synthase